MNSPKRLFLVLIAVFTAFTMLLSCDTTSDSEFEPISVSGLVTDAEDNPLPDAIVRIVDPAPEKFTTTNEAGNYTFELQVDSTISYTIEATKEGYGVKTQEFLAIPERNVNLPSFKMGTDTGDDDNSDNGDDDTDPTPGQESEGSAFIILQSVTEDNIQVRETGGIETAEFEFLITDSTGTPVSQSNAATVNFEIASGPDGGESVYPESVETVNGIAKAALTSGTASGVVQIRASFTRDGNTMQSKPVSITISGGLPSDEHFEVSAGKKNIPSSTSEPNEITVLLGDKYGNTVPEGTAVHFSTNKGTINGSAKTDADGYVSAQLKTNQTAPGVATVQVETVDENSNKLTRQIEVLFSGKPQLSVTTATIDLENFTSETFSVNLADENGNPLAEGTTLSVVMEHPELTLAGDTLVTMGDRVTSGTGTTQFQFSLENPEGVNVTQDVSILVSVDGPNGSASELLEFDAPQQPLGEPASIYLESISETDLGVQSTGQKESSKLTFVVVDENGNPLKQENSTEVNFRFGDAPGGGESITDATVTTDANGRATATVISGTVSGTVQVVAEFTQSDGVTVRSSKPVQLTIHAGLPSQNHFTLKPSSRNIAFEEGGKHGVSAYVGDKYGNEVPDGTAIYFTTDGGFISGSASTVNGVATTELTVANPFPAGGLATLTATTANDNEQPISTITQIIFSGAPQITINPETFNIANAEDEPFDYTVSDVNGNPMAPGTKITVTVEGDEISLLGDIDITVGSPNGSFSNLSQLTDYSFIIDDANPDETNDSPVQITIEVEGPNGSARKSISGRKAKVQP